MSGRAADVAGEGSAGVFGRPVRSLLAAAGAIVAVTAFTGLSGLATSAEASVNQRFDALAATQVAVADTRPQEPSPAFGLDAERRMSRLPGVVAAGVAWSVTASVRPRAPAAAGDATDGRASAAASAVEVVAATPGLLAAVRASYSAGRGLDPTDDRIDARVAVVGVTAAHDLGLGSLDGVRAISIDGIPFTVIGVVDSVASQPTLLTSVVVPAGVAQAVWGPPSSGSQAEIATRPGAAAVVARELPVLLDPGEPSRLQVLTGTEGFAIQGQVESDLTGLLWVVGLVALAVGVLGIAATMSAAMSERTFEIGLRRAMGATRAGIAGQFVVESIIVGGLGGVVGACLGVCVVVGAARTRGWVPVVQPVLFVVGPALGLVAGLLAGLVPALRAARLDPVEALRR